MAEDKQEMNIQWYPGHMTKTRRMIQSQLKHMDAVCEILDARIPLSSRNPDVEELTAGKPRLIVLNRVDMADSEATRRWAAWFRDRGFAVLEANAREGQGTARFGVAVRELLADKLAARGREVYCFSSFDEIENFLLGFAVNGDLLITMGAGDIVKVGEKLLGR